LNDRIQTGAKDDRDFGLPITQLLARRTHSCIKPSCQSGSDIDLRSNATKPDAKSICGSHTADNGSGCSTLIHAAETGGALAGLRVVAITSGRGESSRGAAVLVSCLG
jgi:hypothetical protein